MTWIDDAEPVHAGPAGKAWKFPLPADDGDWRYRATLDANYLIYAPGAHPLWAFHVLMAVHLRDVEGQEAPPHKQFAAATHELMVYALDPDHEPPDPREWPFGGGKLKLLQPPDTVVQFEVGGDDHATAIVDLAAKACTTGLLAPDSDWHQRWTDTIRTTASHYREGRHS